jgi:putative copper export protein
MTFSPAHVGILFIGISLIFVVLVVRDYLKSGGKMTISRRVWLRLALIFAAVGIGLSFLERFLSH